MYGTEHDQDSPPWAMLSRQHNYWQYFSTGLNVSVSVRHLQAQMLFANVNINFFPNTLPFNVKQNFSAFIQFSNRPLEHNRGLFRLLGRNSERYVQNASRVLYNWVSLMCNVSDTDSKAELSSDMRSGPKPLTLQGPVGHKTGRISSVPLLCIWFVPHRNTQECFPAGRPRTGSFLI